MPDSVSNNNLNPLDQAELLVTSPGPEGTSSTTTLSAATLTDYLTQYINPDGSVGQTAAPTAPSNPNLQPPALTQSWMNNAAFIAVAAERLNIMDLAGAARQIAQQAALKNAENIMGYQMSIADKQKQEALLAKAKAEFDGAMEIAQGAVSIVTGGLSAASAAKAISNNKQIMRETDPVAENLRRADGRNAGGAHPDNKPDLTPAERTEMQDNRRVRLDHNRMEEQMRSSAVNAVGSAINSSLKGTQSIIDGDYEFARLNFESEITKLQACVGMEQSSMQTQQAVISALTEMLQEQVSRNNKNDELQAQGFNR